MSEGEVGECVVKNTNDIFSVFPMENESSSSNIALAKKLVHDIIGTGEALLDSAPESDEKAPSEVSKKLSSEIPEVPVNPISNQGGPSSKEQTCEGSVNTVESEDLSSVHSRELKSLLALSKEAKLDTNISRKRKSSDNRKKFKQSESSPKQGVTSKSQKVFHENRNIRYPVTAESELEMDFSHEEAIKTDDSSNKTPKRKKSNVSDASVGGATEENSRKTSRKSLTSEIVMFKPNKDMFCWRCHRDGVNIACETCVRSYHQKCLKQTIGDPKHWPCPECVSILKAESTQTRSEAMKGMTLEHLCGLLKFAVTRMMQCPGSEPFIHPVNDTDFPEYKKYIIQPMDLTLLEKNIKENLYGSTQAFEADAKWILHNSIIFNSYQSKLTNIAKNIIKICKQEMAEIENCPSCYLNANTKKNTWFTEVCPKPHLLVWAKLRGFPYWPGKAMTCKDGMVDVRFFGAHDKAWVPEKECYLYCQKDPNGFKLKRNDIEACVEELTVYVENLKKVYGEFRCAPYKTLIDPSNELGQLRIFLPDYKTYGNKHSKIQKRHSVDVKFDANVKDKKEELDLNEKKNGETPTSPQSTKEEKIEKKEYHSNNNKDTMDGYGTDDDALPEINTELRNKLRYKNEEQTNEHDNGVEADEDDTQVPSNIKVHTVYSTASKGNIKTKGFSNFTGQLKFIPHRSFENESSPQKRQSLEERAVCSPHISRRNSEASNKSDSSRLSNISDKINRIDIPENMELSLGNDDAGGVSISENVSSSNSECSRSENEFSVEIKKKPIQVDIENSEFTISPASKLKISDKLMKRLSDEDQKVERIDDVKKNVLAENKSHTDILIEKLKDTDQYDGDKPSTSTQEADEPSTSTVDKAAVRSNNTEELMDTDVHTTVNSNSNINPPLSPNFIEEMASINSISSLPPTQLMEDAVSGSSNRQEVLEDAQKQKEFDRSITNDATSKVESSNVGKEPSESDDESDNEVLSKFLNRGNLARKEEQANVSRELIEKEEVKVTSQPPKKKPCIQASPKKSLERNGNASEPSEKREIVEEDKLEPKSSPKKKDESRASFEKHLILKVLLEESDTSKTKDYRKPLKQTENSETIDPETSSEGKPKTDEIASKPAEVSPVKVMKSDSEATLTATAKSPTILLIKKSNVERKIPALESVLSKGEEKDGDACVKDQSGDRKTEQDKSGEKSKETSVSPEKTSEKDKNQVVNNIIEEFQDDEMADTLDDSQINNASILNIIHSSLEGQKSKTPTAIEQDADSSSKAPSTEASLKNNKRKLIEGEIDTDKPQKKILRFIPIETILSGHSNHPSEKDKAEEEPSNPLLLKSLQDGAAVTRKPPTQMESPRRSLSTQSSVQEFLTDEIKSEPESETDTSEPENLEAKKRYLSALNILEKTYEKEKAKPHEIRTRSKTEEKREKFKVVDNITRVIDHVAVNYSAIHDGEALPPPKKSGKPQTPQVSNKQEGEIFVKSFAKMIPKQRARKSFPCPNYAKPMVVRPAPEVKCAATSTVSCTEPTATVISTAPARITASVITSASNSQQQQNLQRILKSPPPIQPTPETSRTFMQNGTQPPPLETIRTTSGYIILQQPPQQEVVLLPPNQTISYTTSGVTVPTQVLQMAPCLVSSSPATIKNNITWASASQQRLFKDPNVTTSQNYIPQNENARQEASVTLLPGFKPTTSSPTTVTTTPPTSTNNITTVSSSSVVAATDDQQATVSTETPQSQGELNLGADSEEFGLLNSLLPGNVTRAVTELLRRPPPKLKPRPPGVLSTSFCEGLPSSAGSVTTKINSVAHRLGDYFRGLLIETLDDLGKAQCPEAVISSLKMEMESLKHKHNIELSEIEKNITTVLKDIQRSIVEDRERIVEETRAACEAETIKRIEEAKSKQWCANCGKEAQFYCCWNTSYCDYPCQQKHWPQHMNKCTQNLNGGGVPTNAPASIRPAGGQQLILRPANPPPKGGVGRIFTKPLQKVYMNRNSVAGPKTMKVQTPSGTQLTVMETTPGNYQVVGGPITVRSTQAYTTLKTSNLITVTTAASSSSHSIQQKATPSKVATTRVISHTIPVTTVLDEDSE